MTSEARKALAAKMVAAVKSYVGRQFDARLGSLAARLDKDSQALESSERRLSRHAEHLAKIETRLQMLEKK